VVFSDQSGSLAAQVTPDAPLPINRIDTAGFSTQQIATSNLANISITVGQRTDTAAGQPQASIVVASALSLASGGVLTLQAPVTDVLAPIIVRGGTVNISNSFTSGNAKPDQNGIIPATYLTNPEGMAEVLVATGATIDTHGVWTNLYLSPLDQSTAAYLNGGNVSINCSQNITIQGGTEIDASTGGVISAQGAGIGGAGGNISLQAEDGLANGVSGPGRLVLDGEIRAYGMTKGGSLSIGVPWVVIGQPTGILAADTLVLSSALFQGGFSSYTINRYHGLTVSAGTTIDAVEPSYVFKPDASRVASGADPTQAYTSTVRPEYQGNPVTAQFAMRPGASLNFESIIGPTPQPLSGGSILFQSGSSMTVDPLQSVNVEGYRQITIDGSIRAPGGSISVLNDRFFLPRKGFIVEPTPISVWLGPNSRLDASAEAVNSADLFGRPYAYVPAGGNITLGSLGGYFPGTTAADLTAAFVIVRPGAVLNVDGTHAQIDLAAGSSLGSTASGIIRGNSVVDEESSGGTISMATQAGIYMDGAMEARSGGPYAPGGTLLMTLSTRGIVFLEQLAPALQTAKTFTISQNTMPSSLAPNIRPGGANRTLISNRAAISASQINEAGFANVSLFSIDLFVFRGDVSLTTAGSISLSNGIIVDRRRNGEVTLRAPIVTFSYLPPETGGLGMVPVLQSSAWTFSDQVSRGNFNVFADLIQFSHGVDFSSGASLPDGTNQKILAPDYPGFGAVNFVARDSVAFVGQTTGIGTTGNISFMAGQLYSDGAAVILAGQTPENLSANQLGGVISIARFPGSDPAPPLAAGGSLSFSAQTIYQGGVIRAPEGSITLGGNSTNASVEPNGVVIFLPGSITSTSLVGQTILDGGSTDGITLSTGATSFSQSITIAGSKIQIDPGAVLDLRGGGNLAGAAFISGRGGSVDVLTNPPLVFSPSTDTVTVPSLLTNPVYSIVVGQQANYATEIPVTGSAASGSLPALGSQITIGAGVPGLPSGTYTLLPAYDALLPGGYRVQLSSTLTQLPGVAALANGTYVTNVTTGTVNTGFHSGFVIRRMAACAISLG